MAISSDTRSNISDTIPRYRHFRGISHQLKRSSSMILFSSRSSRHRLISRRSRSARWTLRSTVVRSLRRIRATVFYRTVMSIVCSMVIGCCARTDASIAIHVQHREIPYSSGSCRAPSAHQIPTRCDMISS